MELCDMQPQATSSTTAIVMDHDPVVVTIPQTLDNLDQAPSSSKVFLTKKFLKDIFNRFQMQTGFLRRCCLEKRSTTLCLIGICCYMVYFFYAVVRCLDDCPPTVTDFWTLVGFTCFGLAIALANVVRAFLRRRQFHFHFNQLTRCRNNVNALVQRLLIASHGHIASPMIIWFLVPSACAAYVVIDSLAIRRDSYSLVSMAGVCVILIGCIVTSNSPRQIAARPAVAGIGLQFLFALFVLRFPAGERMFHWLGNLVATFLGNGKAGATFVFRNAYNSGDFAFAILPILPFFGAVTSILYYLGWLQVFVRILASIMQRLTNTTAGESTTCSANVFLGMSEAPLLIRPFLRYMTKSEMHAVMCGGFATIAGSNMAALIALGVEPRHLLAASLMAAPAALALSKLSYPETEETKLRPEDVERIAKEEQGGGDGENKGPQNILEAACEGAAAVIPMVAGIVVNLIAIMSILSFLNTLIAWFGERVGLAPPLLEEEFTLEYIASYLFWPIALAIGIPIEDCRQVAKLIGMKLFTNEFVAYIRLSDMLKSRSSYEDYYCQYVYDDYPPQNAVMLPSMVGDGNSTSLIHEYVASEVNRVVLDGATNFTKTLLFPMHLANGSYFLPMTNATLLPFLTRRGESLAIYILCGFANFASIGIQIGSLSQLVPSKKVIVASVALRAMLTGTAVNLLNAATAGMLLSASEPSWSAICSHT